MAVDPIGTTTSIDLTPVVAPIIQQAVSTATADLAQRVSLLENQIADALVANAPHLEASVQAAGAAVLTNVEQDPLTQRIVVCSIIGAALVGALVILVTALLGNSAAQHYIAAAPALIGGAVLWVSKVGVSLPKPTIKEVIA